MTTFYRRKASSLFSGSVLAISAVLLTTSPSMAQDAADDEIIVTGSRIKQDSTLNAASPVVAVGVDDIKTSGQIDIGALLRESPSLQASLPGSFSAFNGTALGASQLNLRNLGTVRTLVLEDGRRHVAGIEGTGTVDVNTISTALLERVDITTGGASAIYGADAVTGVVNFVMRDGDSFDGMEVRTQAGITGQGDAEEFFVSVANGFEIGDKGSLVFGAEYQKQTSITAGDRDFAGSGLLSSAANSASIQSAFGIDSRFANAFVPNLTLPISSGGGVIALNDGFGSAFSEVAGSGGVSGCDTVGAAQIPTCQFLDSSGLLRPYNPGDVFIDPFAAVGGDAVPTDPDDEILLPEIDRFLLQTRAEYAVHENVNFFADVKYVTTESIESNQVNGFNDDIPIALDNPFIPSELRNQINILTAEGLSPVIGVSRDVLDISARSNPIAERKTLRIVTGFEGDIGDTGFDYELSFGYGRTDADITSRARFEDRYFAAIDAVVDPATGDIVCRSTLQQANGDVVTTPPSSPFPAVNSTFGITTFLPGDGQCVPLNIFGENSISQEAADFVFLPTTSQNEIIQNNILAIISGDTSNLFTLPAGPVDFAVGYEYRKEESRFDPDSATRTGLTFGTLDSRGGPQNPSIGEYEVSEFFAEAEVPLIADKPYIRRLSLNGAIRYSDYDAYENTTTWATGLRYTPTDSLTLRGTYSRAVRVPNIGEAFAPQFTVTLGAEQDPCNPQFIEAGSEFRLENCRALVGPTAGAATNPFNSTNFTSAFVPGVSGGNANLNPEEADTFTIGAVFKPEGEFGGALDGLIVTLDYYDIEIDGLIDSLAGFQIAQNCVDAPTLDNQFCEAIDRDPTDGFITGFRSGQINLAAVETAGVDWRVDYNFDTPASLGDNLGSWRLSSTGTHFLQNDETRDVSAPEAITDVLTTLTRPEWIINFGADWFIGDFTLGWQGRFESSQLVTGVEPEDLVNNPDFINISRTGSSLVHDFTVSYDLKENFEVYGGINNAFDEEPYIGNLSRPAGPRGRFLFLGANVTL